ncbi:hypothetical protein KCU64_g3470, partial [Aureobasidium melanogenum]
MRCVEFDKSNGEMLFEEIDPIKTSLHKSASTILDGSTLVFSWLVRKKHGRLIHIFHCADFDDVKLGDTEHSLLDNQDLRHAYDEYNMGYPFTFDNVVETLEISRWEFFPQHLYPKLENKAFGNKLYIPFCRQEAVTQAGATAVVYVTIIQEEFVSDEIRPLLGPRVDDKNYGICYRLAIKTISETRWNEYSQERRAFKGIDDKRDGTVISSLETSFVSARSGSSRIYGFTVFIAKSPGGSPKTQLKEFTRTWGAPETVQQGTWVLQTVDTWSFGCVLSIAATWMIKGIKGVIEYQEYRSQDRPSDAFHNNGDVLPQIRIWHDHLKQLIRQSDHITGPILDVVEKHLLLKNPEARLRSSELKATLDAIVARARDSLASQSPMDTGLARALKYVEDHPTEWIVSYKSPMKDGYDATKPTGSLPDIGQLPPIDQPETQTSLGSAVQETTGVPSLQPPEKLNARSSSSEASSETGATDPRFEDL